MKSSLLCCDKSANYLDLAIDGVKQYTIEDLLLKYFPFCFLSEKFFHLTSLTYCF